MSSKVFSDTVSIGGLTASNQSVGAAKQYSDGFGSAHFPPDGLMGMVFDIAGLPDTRQEKQVGSAELCFTLDGVSSEDLSDHRLNTTHKKYVSVLNFT